MAIRKRFGSDIPPNTLRLSLCDLSEEMTDAWIDAFRDIDAVEILQGSILDAGGDAIVSPANSFGNMSGGVDKAIDDFYHGAAQEKIQKAIRSEWLGELPVGVAMVVSVAPLTPQFVICAPTMRVPRSVRNTIHAYAAMRGVLVAVIRHNQDNQEKTLLRITRIAIPGLCTGVGEMDYGVCAQQMRVAYDTIIGQKWEQIVHPAMAPYALHRPLS
jgi:O-acetyl-ADP-ribose deacetylase (regulator of RNase III)